MKRFTFYFIIFVFTSFTIKNTFCQEDVIIDYDKMIKIINLLSKSSLFITTPQGSGSGTLFTVPFSDTAKSGAVYLVTALHVLLKTDSTKKVIGHFDTVKVYFNLAKGGIESRKYELVKSYDDLDIAVLQPIEFFRSFQEYDVTAPSLDMVATFSELKKGQSAFVAGYPYNLGTKGEKLNPVTQSGIIAYVDTIHNLVLIDIPVNYGNSGCPVYVLTNKGESKLLGIVFEYQPNTQDFVYSKAFNKMVPVNTSLGRVVLISSILPDLYKLRK